MVSVESHCPKWRRLPEERPQQILVAAFEVFGEKGLAGARLDDIAKRAGVSKGTIYLYFPNKEALFKEMIRQTVVAHLERTERDYEGKRGTAAEQVREYMRDWWNVARTPAYQVVLRLVIGELHRFPELAEFYWQEVILRKQQLLHRLMRRGVESGEFRDIDPAVAGRMIGSMFAAHTVWACSSAVAPMLAATSDAEQFDQIMDFFFRAVAPDRSARRVRHRARCQ